MDLPIQNCIIADQLISAPQVKVLLQYQHLLTYVLLDLQKLDEGVKQLGEKRVLAHNLSEEELDLLRTFSLAKRKREWVGGRFAAKLAISRLLEEVASYKECLLWSRHIISTDENGRPFLSAGKENTAHPYDISISHSSCMAAAMAVHKGYCGIDVQKITRKVMKVSDRFCTKEEKQVIHDSFPVETELQAAPLTKLWAAKEALRKASAMSSLPGFLELELIEITSDPLQKKSGPWSFNFNYKYPAGLAHEKYRVAVIRIGDYALALTARYDTPE